MHYQAIVEFMNQQAARRTKWRERNWYYYEDLVSFLQYNVPQNSRVLEIGCGDGYLLHQLQPMYGVGIDIAPAMIEQAQQKYPDLHFFVMDVEQLKLQETFDYIILSDTIGYFYDVQKVLNNLRSVSHSGTRVLITYQNFLWSPLLQLVELLHLKMPSKKLNWLNVGDLVNLLNLENFEVVKSGHRLLLPWYIPFLSKFMNKYLAHLPLLNQLCLTSFVIARPCIPTQEYSVSVIIPARNERGNIEQAVQRIPHLGKHTEIIFVEGHSNDNTLTEIQRVCQNYADKLDIKYAVQDGKGKGDAVRKGFAMAHGDILMILDADLTVRPEDLPKFYQAIASGKGEFINGCRLVYPMEKEAMRILNMIANRFFSVTFSWLLGQRIKDTLCGTKVICKKAYEQLASNRAFFGDFDPFGDFDLLFGAAKLNLKIVELPIRYQARVYGSTNISRFRHGFILLKMVLFAMNKIKFI
ncbi:MAG: glycosyl transferase [Candidatus Kerfeldbacteria bacterium RIFCSPHIGHO2_02_FULL_42_14]|uniref:Glycosyl transferase n=1 Tax=Candidatus Kerfeldbacteria bacterium RIFCSPHIGHO2_02_FULL_42_14 TaxID=1798540 RepID=A0A1G2AR09_9BACT|nr:MAG: glycosyl transferase [Candidatus Kerfeldbacteria bacterium RIFCSPHIGHO2_02_FULL_42_14]OGY81460.1 MAG: glycosyl transferase [Candidatus Kerfeldbacteria bacterium RIFCSPHIGHO2_12_FULL_42_13]OGY83507.1 MAG: glycosyl transferase [Candidatus Kerfeldbacteria bacterium RIFCSPLOWO2_02_FULL_42_19]OGY86966.1 MAG: glycosyl transferase [Candidatus Kerfeldbacteria bacterium RIFCSPLOWO2_12_FULL_43_9]